MRHLWILRKAPEFAWKKRAIMSLFDEMLQDADKSNRQRKEHDKYAHLPQTLDEGLAYSTATFCAAITS